MTQLDEILRHFTRLEKQRQKILREISRLQKQLKQ